MNALTIQASAGTMSSREVAELTGKEHRHVMRDLRTLQKQLGDLFGGSVQNWAHPQNGQDYEEFLLDKDTCLVLLLGYNAVARMKVVKRWQELEASAAPVVPQTMAQALRLAADQAEQIEAQQLQIEHQRPAVEFVERYTDSTGNKGFREVCKLLGAKENQFRQFLAAEMIMYKLAGEWVPYAPHLNAGRFAVKTGMADHGDHGHAFNQAKFTPKGVAWVAGEWAKYNAIPANSGE